jgi:hypothetical protein
MTLLVDGGCFSTCGHFAAVFKEHQLGKIVGTNTGGGASCTDSSINVVLRNTGIRLHNSLSMYSVVADSSMRNMVVPCIKSTTIGGRTPHHMVDLVLNEETETQEISIDVYHNTLNQYIDER